jgi:hypothetical protein
MSIISCTSPAPSDGDLAGLERDQAAQIALGGAQFFAEQAHQLAAARRRHVAPGLEGLVRAADGAGGLDRRGLRHLRDHLAGDRRAHRQLAAGVRVAGHAQALQQLLDFGGDGTGRCWLQDMGALRGGGERKKGNAEGAGNPANICESRWDCLVKKRKDLMRLGNELAARTCGWRTNQATDVARGESAHSVKARGLSWDGTSRAVAITANGYRSRVGRCLLGGSGQDQKHEERNECQEQMLRCNPVLQQSAQKTAEYAPAGPRQRVDRRRLAEPDLLAEQRELREVDDLQQTQAASKHRRCGICVCRLA